MSLFLNSNPFRIEKISDLYPYSSNSHAIFHKICIRIRISFKKYENGYRKGTIRFTSDPFPPLGTTPALAILAACPPRQMIVADPENPPRNTLTPVAMANHCEQGLCYNYY
jgi:hypothetical protein